MNRDLNSTLRASGGVLAVTAILCLLPACADIDERPARWSYLHPAIIAPSCATASCHSNAAALAGLDLSTRDNAYVYLTGRVCGAPPHAGEPPGNFVFPYAPERSPLVHLLRGTEVRVMPPDIPLPESEVRLIERWILEGASCE